MKGQIELAVCETSELKTECRLLPPLAPATSAKSQRYRALWKKAFMRLKMDRAVRRIGDEILLFGTQNELLDQNMQYKANIDELIDKKARKQENFRVHFGKDSVPRTFRCFLTPASRFKTCWNLVLCSILTYTAFVMPWRIAFETLVFWDEWAVFELIVDILFLVDVAINFFTILIEPDGTMIDDHWEVAKRYLTSWFLVDVTACIPFPLIEYLVGVDEGQRSEKYNSLMRLFRLPRLYKLFRITRVLRMFRASALTATTDKLTEFLQVNPRFAKLGKFLLACSVCVHVAACLWFFLARISNFDPQCWVVYFQFYDNDQWSQYLIAVYWAVTTITTVGYGDVHPVSDVERMFCVVWMLFGVGFYSFIIGSLSSLLTTIDSRESVIQAKLAAVEEFVAETKISKELKRKIHKEVRRNAHDRGLIWSDKYSLLAELPKSLRFVVASTMYDGIYSSFPLFFSKNTAFVSYVMPRLRPSSYENDEFLFKEGDFADTVYFICEGRVNLVTAESGIVYKSFIRGSYIGEIEVVFSQPRANSAQCFGECELLLMTRNDLLDILKEFPSEAKVIQKHALERQKKNASAYRETVRLLELKREKGTLRHLAGQARLSNIEEVEETDEERRTVANEYFIDRVMDTSLEIAKTKQMVERLARKIDELQCDTIRMAGCRSSPRDLLERLRRRVPR